MEILLEQIFSQTPVLCLEFIAVIEDASVFISRVIGTSAASATLPIRRQSADSSSRSQSPEENSTSSIGISSNESGGKSVTPPIISPTYYPTHYELEGIPIISTMDIQLLLVCSRAINGGQRVEGEIQLPAMLFDCSDRPSKGALAVSNALLLVILCSTCLKEYIELLQILTESVSQNNDVSLPESCGDHVLSSDELKAPHEFIYRDCNDSTASLILSGSSAVIKHLLSSNDTGSYSDSSGYFSTPHHLQSATSQPSALSSSHSATSSSSATASSSSQSQSHSEECTPECITWMSAVKSTELVAACLYLSCCPHLVHRSVSLATDVLRTVRTARRKCVWYSMGYHGVAPSIAPVQDQDLSSGSALVAAILVATFEAVSVCRPAILTSLLKGLLVCGDYTSHKHGISSRSHGQRKSIIQTAHSGTGDVQTMIIHFACTVFHRSLRSLCEKFPCAISGLTNVLDAYVPLLSLVPLSMLPSTMFPIIRIAGYSAGIVLTNLIGVLAIVCCTFHRILYCFRLYFCCKNIS